MKAPEPAGGRVVQLRDLGPHPALGHLREHRGVALTCDERADHLPARLGQLIRRHRRQFHAGAFEDLVEPLGLPGPFLDDRFAIPGEITQRPERFRRNETRPYQAMLKQRRPHTASATSVLRRGRFRISRALITRTSGTDASKARWTGFQ